MKIYDGHTCDPSKLKSTNLSIIPMKRIMSISTIILMIVVDISMNNIGLCADYIPNKKKERLISDNEVGREWHAKFGIKIIDN